jgi:hypothetical protein
MFFLTRQLQDLLLAFFACRLYINNQMCTFRYLKQIAIIMIIKTLTQDDSWFYTEIKATMHGKYTLAVQYQGDYKMILSEELEPGQEIAFSSDEIGLPSASYDAILFDPKKEAVDDVKLTIA